MSKTEIICNRLIAEAQACKEYSECIEECLKMPNGGKSADMLDDMRIDCVEHLQQLVEALTDCFFEESSEESVVSKSNS